MFDISNNGIITITRGDSASIPLFINCNTKLQPYRYPIKSIGVKERAKIYLGVMEPNQPFEHALIRKKYDSQSLVNNFGDLIIKFLPNDTEYLKPGKYYYLVKLLRFDEEGHLYIDTIIPLTQFFIL